MRFPHEQCYYNVSAGRKEPQNERYTSFEVQKLTSSVCRIVKAGQMLISATLEQGTPWNGHLNSRASIKFELSANLDRE